MKSEECEFFKECQCECDGSQEKTECCECYRLHQHIKMLVNAINQGTKKFSYKEAHFLHEAMSNHFEFCTGLNVDDILDY